MTNQLVPDGSTPSRADAEALDAADPLAGLRARFYIAETDRIYLNGNSLGRLPAAAVEAVTRTMTDGWGAGLASSWSEWVDLPGRIGDRLASVVLGASPGEVVVADSTSVNLYKLASAVLDACPERGTIVIDEDDFPSDRYVMQGLACNRGKRLVTIRGDIDNGLRLDTIRSAVDSDVALVVLSLVAYRSGARLDMAAINAVAHAAGARVLWDLSHAAGAVPIALNASGAELAAGCTYKYLSGGPGAPGFAYVARALHGRLRQPIWGWFGQRDQFAMGRHYDPLPAISQLLAGTPDVLSMTAIEPSLTILEEAGMPAVRAKVEQQTELVVRLAGQWLAPLGFQLASPPEAPRRGAHVSLMHPDAWRICRALAEQAKVVADFRVPDRLRLGVAPLYTRFVDIWDAMNRLRLLAESRGYEPVSPVRSGAT